MDFKAHFATFCTGDNQACTYEDWIDALLLASTSSQSSSSSSGDGGDSSTDEASSSAASSSTGILLDFEGMAKVIDPKYYSEDCDERRFWNANATAGSGRTEVAARQSDESLTADSSSAMADFLPPVDAAATAGAAKEVTGDLLSFE